VLDFSSALYLGFMHPSVSLAPWRALKLGRPAALQDPPCSRQVAQQLADLCGAPTGLLFPSTLHLFRDLFGAIASDRSLLLVDAGAYPIARWGMESVRLQGATLAIFPHHDTEALARQARRAFRAGQRPVVVTDGLCPACGRLAPLPELARIAADYGGSLVVDDTQAVGIVGTPSPGNTAPLGHGGGGTLAWYGLGGPHVWVGSSLAKAFGAPLAVLLGAKVALDNIARNGGDRGSDGGFGREYEIGRFAARAPGTTRRPVAPGAGWHRRTSHQRLAVAGAEHCAEVEAGRQDGSGGAGGSRYHHPGHGGAVRAVLP
jgi:8-amino-7-oxononanoate synthase